MVHNIVKYDAETAVKIKSVSPVFSAVIVIALEKIVYNQHIPYVIIYWMLLLVCLIACFYMEYLGSEGQHRKFLGINGLSADREIKILYLSFIIFMLFFMYCESA